MKIYHFITSIDRSNGGPSESVTSLIRGQIDFSDATVKLFTEKSNNPVIRKFLNTDEVIDFFEPGFLGRFSNLKIQSNRLSPIILHGHGIWELPIHQMALLARKARISYIISPRGMLEPWALQQSKWKKNIAMLFYQKRDLKHAFCLHATSEKEANSIRKLGLKNPIAIIPNGIEIPDFKQDSLELFTPKNKVLFLSRIHPSKGVENLIAAWSNIPQSIKIGWKLEIVGTGDDEYIDEIKRLVIQENLQESISISDPVFDELKKEKYLSADIFVLPTFSENFGMVVVEAMSHGVPVITTKGAPWEELELFKAGWWIEIGVESLTQALINAIYTPKQKLIEMGLNGRKLVAQKYSIENVAKQMLELYSWVLHKGSKPDFIKMYHPGQ